MSIIHYQYILLINNTDQTLYQTWYRNLSLKTTEQVQRCLFLLLLQFYVHIFSNCFIVIYLQDVKIIIIVIIIIIII